MTLGSIFNAYPNGRPSGLPTDIVDQLVQVKQYQLLNPIQQDMATVSNRKDNYNALNTQLVTLYKATNSLDDADSFLQKNASSSDSSIFTIATSSDAHIGNYSITVSSLAKQHRILIGVSDENSTTGVTQGISNPDDSSLISDDVTISFYHQGKSYSYTTDSSSTLTSIAEKITGDNNGVYASVVNIGTDSNPQYVLSLQSETSGASSHQMTTDPDSTTPGITISSDLFTTGTTEQETVQAGENAKVTVDGIEYERSSNEIDDIIPGATVTLVNPGEATATISLDINSIVSNVQALVTAYNNFDKFMDDNASYDLENKKAGPLLGDSIARGAQSNIRGTLSSAIPGSTDKAFQYLSQIGIQFNEDGTLNFDANSLEEALSSHPEDVKYLFTGENGIATRLKKILGNYTDSSRGIITSTIRSIDSKIEDLNDEYTEAQQKLEDYQEQTVKKYSHLEEVVLKYKAIQEQLDSYIDQWKNMTKTSTK